MSTKKALVYRTSEKGIKASVENFEDYQGMQQFVGGLIERVVIPFRINSIDYDVYVNEEGMFLDNPPSMVLYYNGEVHNIIKGNFFISKVDEDGESVSLTDDEIMEIREYIAKNTHGFKYKDKKDNEFSRKLFVAHY